MTIPRSSKGASGLEVIPACAKGSMNQFPKSGFQTQNAASAKSHESGNSIRAIRAIRDSKTNCPRPLKDHSAEDLSEADCLI